ncbi:MAG: DUF5320 domain-containing protein [Bacteroidota bacterium]
MPGLDHKGPLGQGPRTGRQQGNCAPDKNSNEEKRNFPHFGRGRRRGNRKSGRGFGLRLGRGRYED